MQPCSQTRARAVVSRFDSPPARQGRARRRSCHARPPAGAAQPVPSTWPVSQSGIMTPVDELQQLDRRHAQRAALPQPPEGEAGMEQEGQEQDQLRRGRAPETEEDGAAGLHGRRAKQAQRVVGEMGGGEQEEDEAGPQTQAGQVQERASSGRHGVQTSSPRAQLSPLPQLARQRWMNSSSSLSLRSDTATSRKPSCVQLRR